MLFHILAHALRLQCTSTLPSAARTRADRTPLSSPTTRPALAFITAPPGKRLLSRSVPAPRNSWLGECASGSYDALVILWEGSIPPKDPYQPRA
jgi:hypothetical protein